MITTIITFIRDDYRTCWWRATLETIGMLLGAIVAVTLAVTTPHPPMLLCYSLWVMASLVLATATWHRGSFGLTASYATFFVVDSIGLIRTLIGE